MNLELDNFDGKYLGPTCYPLIYNTKNVSLDFNKVGIRHPIGTFNVAIMSVARSFSKSLNHFDSIEDQSAPPEHDRQDLLEAHEDLLYSIMEYFDATKKIAECYYNDNEKSMKSPYKVFCSKTKKTIALVANIVNAIKHNQNRLTLIHSKCGYFGTYGYFVSAPLSHKSIGPNPTIHKKYNGLATAFSFNKNFRFLFANIYEQSENLRIFLSEIGYKEPLKPDNDGNDLFLIAQRISKLSVIYFIDEIKNPIPRIYTEDSAGNRVLKIDTECNEIKFAPMNGVLDTRLFLYGDGSTDTYELPYFNKDKNGPAKHRLI